MAGSVVLCPVTIVQIVHLFFLSMNVTDFMEFGTTTPIMDLLESTTIEASTAAPDLRTWLMDIVMKVCLLNINWL